LRVAFFHHYSLTHGGGGEGFLIELANFLASRGHRVEIHALPFRRRNVSPHLRQGVTYCEGVVHHAEADVSYHMYAPMLSHLFHCSGPRIAGLHGAVVADYDSPAGFYFRQGPYVAGAYVFRETVGRFDLDGFNLIHAVSPVPISHPPVRVLPNWVDCSNSARALEHKREPEGVFSVLYVGKPSYTKGFDRFEALSEMLSGNGIEFWAAFPPDPAYHGNARIKWLGYIPHEEMWGVYAKASVLLHPTRQETFGRVILESLAAGTPVITTPIPSHTSLQLPLEYAATLPNMKAAIERIHAQWQTDYDDYYRSAAASAHEVTRFDAQVLLPQYEDMVREVARGSSG